MRILLTPRRLGVLASTASSYLLFGWTTGLCWPSSSFVSTASTEQNWYDYLVLAITKEAVRLVLDFVEHPPKHHPCTALKQSLLDSHQLTDYQKFAALHKMEPLGGRKPSGPPCWSFVLKAMREASLSLLGEDDPQNVRALAKKADALWSLHGIKTRFSASVASLVDVEEPSQVSQFNGSNECGGRGGQPSASRGRS
jgi:hypothetical protein